VIDIRAGQMSPTLAILNDIGFIRAAADMQISFALFHVLGPTIASLEEIAETADYLGDAHYFIVKNFINNSQFFEWHDATYRLYFNQFNNAVEVTVPKLNEMAMEQVDIASVPFATFVANKLQNGSPASYSFVLRGYVHNWLDKVWAEYDRINLLQLGTRGTLQNGDQSKASGRQDRVA